MVVKKFFKKVLTLTSKELCSHYLKYFPSSPWCHFTRYSFTIFLTTGKTMISTRAIPPGRTGHYGLQLAVGAGIYWAQASEQPHDIEGRHLHTDTLHTCPSSQLSSPGQNSHASCVPSWAHTAGVDLSESGGMTASQAQGIVPLSWRHRVLPGSVSRAA